MPRQTKKSAVKSAARPAEQKSAKVPIDPRLDVELANLSKPAQRALVSHSIFSARDLARFTRKDVAAMHGIGPSAFPILDATLKSAGLQFKA